MTARRNHAFNVRPDSLGELLSIAGLLRLPVHRGETGASERLEPRERTRDHFHPVDPIEWWFGGVAGLRRDGAASTDGFDPASRFPADPP